MIFYATCGLPASGKSSWARSVVLAGKPGEAVVVNRDSLRTMLHNDAWSKDAEKITVAVRNSVLGVAMSKGVGVVISDDTNLDPNVMDELRLLARSYGYTFIVKDFTDVPLDTCLERDSLREGKAKVGPAVIRGMYNRYLKED